MRRTAQLLAGLALLAGCGGGPVTPDTAGGSRALATPTLASDDQSPVAGEGKDLARLRQATVAFHDFDQARAAGWSAKITSCMQDPAAGGMGFHYGNPGLIDGSVSVEEPELLLYEPEKNGKLRLVAVEYIIPYTFHSRAADPPVLFDQKFSRNDVFQLWGLHAWVWRDNPSGIFAPWNPQVNCDNTTDVMAMAHN
ncbi:MAG: hypothetical protein ABJB95_06900 [Gemmatimonadales bacterium]